MRHTMKGRPKPVAQRAKIGLAFKAFARSHPEYGKAVAERLKGLRHSEASREKASLSRKKFYASHPDWIKRHAERIKAYYLAHPEKHPNLLMARRNMVGKKGYISKGQYALYLETKKLYADAELNFPIKTSSGHLYFADVCIPSLKEILEYDGAYWHRDAERDKLRDYNLQLDGWKIRHILEAEVTRPDC